MAKVAPRVKTSKDLPSLEDAGSVADKSECVGAISGTKCCGKRPGKAVRDPGEEKKNNKKPKLRSTGLRAHDALCKCVIPVTLILM